MLHLLVIVVVICIVCHRVTSLQAYVVVGHCRASSYLAVVRYSRQDHCFLSKCLDKFAIRN